MILRRVIDHVKARNWFAIRPSLKIVYNNFDLPQGRGMKAAIAAPCLSLGRGRNL